jgi:signal transduction histidine kinase
MTTSRAQSERYPSGQGGLRAGVIWTLAAIILALLLIQTVNLWSRHRETVQATEARASALANILAEHMRSAMGEVDASLKQLVLHSSRVGGPNASSDLWLPVLHSAMAGMSHLGSLTIVDSTGVIRHSTLPLLVGQSRSEGFIFKHLSTDPLAGLTADTPFRSLLNGRILIPLGRRLAGPGGSFDGAVVATLTPEAFREFYKSVDVGRGGIIWVVHPTGLVLCSEPRLGEQDEGFASAPQALADALMSSGAGIAKVALQKDGPTYVNAWRTVNEPALSVAVSFNLPEALWTWRQSMLLSVGWTLLLSLTLGAASLQLIRQLNARAAAERALVQRDRELLEAQRIADLGSARIFFPSKLVRPSPQLATMLELSNEPDDFALDRLLDRMVESDRARLREAIDSCIESGTRYEIEIQARLSNGTDRILHSEGVLESGAGEGASILAIFEDVTERHRVQQRASQAERIAALGRLTGGVAHDFNNLLTAIIGYSDLIHRRLDRIDPMKGEVEEILKAARRAAELTGQLLAFSRAQVLQPKVIDLNRILIDISPMLRRVIGEDIRFATNLSESLGCVKADPGQIEQVIINLAVNARDAMPKGGQLTVETANVDLDDSFHMAHPSTEPGSYIMMSISDTGHGIDKQILPHIFEPFFTTKTSAKGTGLGLATVYGIVKQSGGTVSVDSEPGRGTTFKVYLPRVFEVIEGSDSRAAAQESLKGKETILIVEDEGAVRMLVRRILETQGYNVLEAFDAQNALQLLSRYKGTIHLMITDVVMPNMSGRELVQHLRDSANEIPVLYMSGYTDDAMENHGIFEPGIPFLQKPFTPDSLSRKVREVLDAL